VKPETQKALLKQINNLRVDTGDRSYADVISGIREILGPPLKPPGVSAAKCEVVALVQRVLSSVLLIVAGKILPGAENAERFQEYLSRIDTEEKLEALLISLDEPTRRERRVLTVSMKVVIPGLRRFMLEGAKLLRNRGGQRERYTEAEKHAIRKEIVRRRGSGVTLTYLFGEIASRRKFSPKTVQRAWLEGDEKDTNSLRQESRTPEDDW
jgi:hypothetical protein